MLRGICRPPGSVVRQHSDPETAPIRRPAAPFLSELVVWDGPHTRHYITPGHLETWGIDASQAFHVARGNLPAAQGLTRAGRFFELAAGDGYESSRLLLPGWLEAFSDLVEGEPVAAAPDARRLLVCGSEDLEAVTELAALAFRAYRNAGDPVSPGLYARHEGELVPLLHSAGPLAPVLRRNQLVLAGQQYRLQQQEVDAEAHLADFSVFVGPQFAVSLAQLRQGPRIWLPVVDFVVLEDDSGSTRTVAWPDIVESCKTKLLLDMVPPRIEVLQFPRLLDLPEAPIKISLS